MIYPTEFKRIIATGGFYYDFYVNNSQDELKAELEGILTKDLCEILQVSNKSVIRIYVNKNSNPDKPDFKNMVKELCKKVEIKTAPHQKYITCVEKREKGGRPFPGMEMLGKFVDLLN